jgi:hypothetical protein
MNKIKRSLLVLPVILTLGASMVQGQTVVRQTSDGDLMVIEFRGKPPHKRRFISQDDEQAYARYVQMLDSVLVASESTRRLGPPSKNMATRQSVTVERVPQSDISRIARFEEASDVADSAPSQRRFWRGAPGKGRPRISR